MIKTPVRSPRQNPDRVALNRLPTRATLYMIPELVKIMMENPTLMDHHTNSGLVQPESLA